MLIIKAFKGKINNWLIIIIVIKIIAIAIITIIIIIAISKWREKKLKQRIIYNK